MPGMIQCPSCNSEKLQKLAVINSDEISNLYKRNKIFIQDLFDNALQINYFLCENCSLKFFNPAVTGNENFYNQLQELDWYYLHDGKTEFTYSSELVQPGYRVLDVGSGRGVWAKYLKEKPGVFYQGIEYSSKSIDLARQDGVNVIKESIETHAGKFCDYYDIVVAFQVLEHIDDIQNFIRACLSCMKKGGQLIIAVPNNDGFIKKMTNNWLNIPPHHINHWNESSLRKLGEQFHLKVKQVFKEKVMPVHKLLFYNINIYSKLAGMFGIKPKLIDSSLKFRVLNKVSYWLSKLLKSVSNIDSPSDGHTIIIVFEK